MKQALLFAILVSLVLFLGCSGIPAAPKNDHRDSIANKQDNTSADKAAPNITLPTTKNSLSQASLAGLHLGNSKDDVLRILGTDYAQTLLDEPAYFGEQRYMWEYENGVQVTIGKESLKVLAVSTYSPDFSTDLGVKVGDSAKTALDTYRAKHQEYQGMYSDGKNVGWFEVEDGVFLILDLDRDDGTKINESVREDSIVEVIELAYSRGFE